MKRIRIPLLVLCAFGAGLLAQGPLQANAQSMFEQPSAAADGKIPDRFGSVVRYELPPAAAGSSRFAWVDLSKVAAVEGAQGSMNTWRTVIYLPGGPLEVSARHQDVMRELMKSRGEGVVEPAE
jgi:hypothetical protein